MKLISKSLHRLAPYVVVAAICVSISPFAIAQKQSEVASQGKSAAADSNTIDPSEYKKLEGGVKVLILTLSELKDARQTVKRVKKTASDMQDEVNRRLIQMQTRPNVVGTTVINIPQPVEMGELPARKEWIDLYMANLTPLLKMMQKNVRDVENGTIKLVVREDIKKSFQSLLETWKTTVKDTEVHLTALQSLTAQGPPYKNRDIDKQAKIIEKDAKKLEKTAKRIEKLFKKKPPKGIEPLS